MGVLFMLANNLFFGLLSFVGNSTLRGSGCIKPVGILIIAFESLHLDGFITGVAILPILGLLRAAEHSVILGF